MITALKQLYEQNHTGDLRALKKAYEQHAEDCAQAAELTVDAGRRRCISSWTAVDRGGRRAPDDAHYRRCTHLVATVTARIGRHRGDVAQEGKPRERTPAALEN